MDKNFQIKYRNPMHELSIASKLINAINNNIELTLIQVRSSYTKVYKLVPKSYKYKNHSFYIKCILNNKKYQIKFDEFDRIDDMIIGIFDNLDSAKEELINYLKS